MDKNYIIEQLERSGKKQAQLARFLDLDPTVVNKIVKGRRLIKSDEADQIRVFFGDAPSSSVEYTAAPTNALPLIGNVQAGAFIEAFELETDEFFPAFGSVASKENVFCLKVIGDSMDIVYPEGTILYCQQLSDYAADLKNGKRVIVKRRKAADLFEVTVKEYSSSGNTTTLTPLSKNKKHKAVKFTNGGNHHHDAGAPDLEVWAIVIGAYQVEG